jgi:hypothetical protein
MTNHNEGHFTISIDGLNYDPATQTHANKELYWQNVLKDARKKRKVPLCCCNPDATNQLAIRLLQGKREYYFLAKYPDQGATHQPTCRFYAKAAFSGLQGYTRDVVEEVDEGFKIKLELGRQVRELSATSEIVSSAGDKGAPRTRKRTMQLLRLLHFLFTLGRLNIWYPKMKGRRTWNVVTRVIFEEAGKVICGSAKLADQLLVGITVDAILPAGVTKPANDSGRQDREQIKLRNEVTAREAQKNNQRLVVVGQFQKYAHLTKDESPLPGRLPLQQYDGLPFLNMDAELWAMAEKRFPQTWAAWKRGERVCAVARLEHSSEPRFPGARQPKGWTVVGVAIQGLSDTFIPVESSYEKQVADLLVAQDRVFEKPLRYDTDLDEVFPDFLLLDTDIPLYPMEVFGRTDEKYEKRAVEKQNYYRQHFENNWWCWKASTDTVIPELPNAAARRES